MNNNIILVKIIMPSDVVFAADSTMVNIPGEDGLFGVLPGHAKLISAVGIGIISIFTKGEERRFFVHGGIAQINDIEVNIVSEFAISLDKNNKEDILNKITDFRSALNGAIKNSLQADILENKINQYEALLKFI